MKYFLFIAYILLLITSCTNNSRSLNSKEKIIVHNSIENILELLEDEEISNCFIVNPFFKSLSFDNYTQKTKTEFFIKSGYNDESILKIVNSINNEFEGKFSKDLMELSKCNESDNILIFSGFNDKLVTVQMITAFSKISSIDLKNQINYKTSQIDQFTFFLNEKGEIIDNLQEIIIYN